MNKIEQLSNEDLLAVAKEITTHNQTSLPALEVKSDLLQNLMEEDEDVFANFLMVDVSVTGEIRKRFEAQTVC